MPWTEPCDTCLCMVCQHIGDCPEHKGNRCSDVCATGPPTERGAMLVKKPIDAPLKYRGKIVGYEPRHEAGRWSEKRTRIKPIRTRDETHLEKNATCPSFKLQGPPISHPGELATYIAGARGAFLTEERRGDTVRGGRSSWARAAKK